MSRKGKVIKVQIFQTGCLSYWYAHKIGEVFEVFETPIQQTNGTLDYRNISGGFIEVADCRIIDELEIIIQEIRKEIK